MDAMGTRPLLDFIGAVMGSWPVLTEHWNETSFEWLPVLKRAKKYGYNMFLPWAVGTDYENPTNNLIFFSQASLLMGSRKYYVGNSSTNAILRTTFKDFNMRESLVILKNESGHISKESLAIIQADVDAIFEFDTFLAEVIMFTSVVCTIP